MAAAFFAKEAVSDVWPTRMIGAGRYANAKTLGALPPEGDPLRCWITSRLAQLGRLVSVSGLSNGVHSAAPAMG